MHYTPDEIPQRIHSERLVFEELADELMIYDTDRHKAFCLNQCASFVWKHLDGKRTIGEIAELMGEHFGNPVKEQVVQFALDMLSKDGLLIPSTHSPANMTRRTLLQKFSIGTAAAPVVTVLFLSQAKPDSWRAAGRDTDQDNRRRQASGGGLWALIKGWL